MKNQNHRFAFRLKLPPEVDAKLKRRSVVSRVSLKAPTKEKTYSGKQDPKLCISVAPPADIEPKANISIHNCGFPAGLPPKVRLQFHYVYIPKLVMPCVPIQAVLG